MDMNNLHNRLNLSLQENQKRVKKESTFKKKMRQTLDLTHEYKKDGNTKKNQLEQVVKECNWLKDITKKLKDELKKANEQLQVRPDATQREKELY